jgi:hypothetical protein
LIEIDVLMFIDRYHRGGYRRLKKYRVPVIVEMDEDVDYEDVRTGTGNDVVSDKSTGNTNWYSERPGHDQWSDHGNHHHRIRGHAVNANILTTIEILMTKLKAAKAMKIILLLATKLKLLLLFKLHILTKLFALAQTLKLLTTLSNPWSLLANANVAATVIANVLNTLNVGNAGNAGNTSNTGKVIGTAAFCRNTLASHSRVDGAHEGRTIAVAASVVSTWTNR